MVVGWVNMAVRMQLFRFLSLLWGLFFSPATHSGSHCLNSNGPRAIRDGQGDMRWGRKHEECMCVWGGKDNSTMVMSQTDWALLGEEWHSRYYQLPCDETPTYWVVDAVTKLGMWQYLDTMLWVYIYFFNICISSFMRIHKHTHKDNRKIEEGRPYL